MKSKPFTFNDLSTLGMIETSPGVFEKVGIKGISNMPQAKPASLPNFNIHGGIMVHVKPLSVNKAWQGKRFKTKEYKEYEKAVMGMLPDLKIPKGPLKVTFIFGFSSPLADLDNPQKLFLDILQKRYFFNDSQVYELHSFKEIVPKREEYCNFTIKQL